MAKLIGIILGLVVFVSFPFFLFGDQIERFFSGNGIVSWMQSYGDFAWLAAIGLLVADLAIPVPTTAVMAALGMTYGPVYGGVFASLGSIISGLVGYILCRQFGRPFALWLSGEKGLEEGERIFQSFGGWIVAMSRWIPVVSEVIACLAGLSRMRFSIFSVALLCGSIPLGFLFSTIGYMGENQPILTLFLSAILPFIFWMVARPFINKMRQT